ncbi:hypothetical protein NQ318_022880 [Aromia moschata]|uniref:VWFA domain-containing protein n=1 Tax=Aromia moschata TaxID=1265417 RepID=A0AAV8XH79_9CUCU|nr:hypothetical protein NQ318_022880 [Aromia moschata]
MAIQLQGNGNTITRVVLETHEKFELSISHVVIFMTDGAPTITLIQVFACYVQSSSFTFCSKNY